jgi:hypothetical protein
VRVGDLVLYYNNNRIPLPHLGIILQEHHNIAVDHRFFSVLLNTGRKQIISDHYLSLPGANPPEDDLG